MLIVDSQVHIWGAHTPERPWPRWAVGTPDKPRNVALRPVPVSADDVLADMKVAGIDRAVIVPPAFEGDRNDLALEAAQRYPDRFAVMGRFEGRMEIDTPSSREQVAHWRERPGMLGMRLTFKAPPHRPIIAERRADWLWEECEKAGVPIMILIDYDQAPIVDSIAERYPGLKLMLDHLCLVTHKKDAEAFAGLDDVLALARRPNVAVKASALPCYSSASYPYRNLFPYLRRVYDAYGPQRMFWGTDHARLPCTYQQALTMFSEEIPWLSEEDKEWVLGRGVCEWMGWKLP